MARWTLDPREVASGYESAGSPTVRHTDLPKDANVSEYTLFLEHRKTGLRVEGRVPRGRHDTRQRELMEIELRKSLFAELELKVARHLGKKVS